ncbi:DDE-type integrase/transposase/recombinase [Ruegeria sp. Alg231-54]|uniref:DDE-type integrase/transposase/recombinase n=1 Tax=Ruegeria sp. Alg231-54 TaxID=1922221 RepID=UPI001900EF6A|nr:DDE-type integrase/transposase/recombinase [Ruegeria sp. Alg231-54]
MTIVTGKVHSYGKVIKEISSTCSPQDAIPHFDHKHLNNRIETDHGSMKQPLRPKRGFRSLTSAKNTLCGLETFRAIRKGRFASNPTGVRKEITFLEILLPKAA